MEAAAGHSTRADLPYQLQVRHSVMSLTGSLSLSFQIGIRGQKIELLNSLNWGVWCSSPGDTFDILLGAGYIGER